MHPQINIEENTYLDLNAWNKKANILTNKYNSSQPFPYIILDDFLNHSCANQLLKDFPSVTDEGWTHYLHINEQKHGLNKLDTLPEYMRQVLKYFNSEEFVKFLVNLTGIENLIPDDSFEGGGLHQSKRNGFLNVHADFTVHPHKRKWRRRINVLIYLNKNWKDEYNGDLEFWSEDMKNCEVKISPLFNRCVIFNTNETSFHGVPEPILCPEDNTRKSIALYYYTEESVAPRKRATNYKARPKDGSKKILIYLDKKILAFYNSIKGTLGINDEFVSKILAFLNRKKK